MLKDMHMQKSRTRVLQRYVAHLRIVNVHNLSLVFRVCRNLNKILLVWGRSAAWSPRGAGDKPAPAAPSVFDGTSPYPGVGKCLSEPSLSPAPILFAA